MHEPIAIRFAGIFVAIIPVQNPEHARQPIGALKERRLGLPRQVGKRLMNWNLQASCQRVQGVRHVARSAAGPEAAVEKRPRGIHHDLHRIERPAAAQASASLAGAERAVEGKRAWLELRNARAAVRAGEFLRIQTLLSVHDRYLYQTARELRGRLDGCREALLYLGLNEQAVNDYFDGVVLPPVEGDLLIKRAQHAVDARPHESLPGQLVQLFLVFALAPAYDRRQNHHAFLRPQREHLFENLFAGLARDLVAAVRAMRHSDRRVEYAQVIVNLSDRADG